MEITADAAPGSKARIPVSSEIDELRRARSTPPKRHIEIEAIAIANPGIRLVAIVEGATSAKGRPANTPMTPAVNLSSTPWSLSSTFALRATAAEPSAPARIQPALTPVQENINPSETVIETVNVQRSIRFGLTRVVLCVF